MWALDCMRWATPVQVHPSPQPPSLFCIPYLFSVWALDCIPWAANQSTVPVQVSPPPPPNSLSLTCPWCEPWTACRERQTEALCSEQVWPPILPHSSSLTCPWWEPWTAFCSCTSAAPTPTPLFVIPYLSLMRALDCVPWTANRSALLLQRMTRLCKVPTSKARAVRRVHSCSSMKWSDQWLFSTICATCKPKHTPLSLFCLVLACKWMLESKHNANRNQNMQAMKLPNIFFKLQNSEENQCCHILGTMEKKKGGKEELLTYITNERCFPELHDAILGHGQHLCGNNGTRHRFLALHARLQKNNTQINLSACSKRRTAAEQFTLLSGHFWPDTIVLNTQLRLAGIPSYVI